MATPIRLLAAITLVAGLLAGESLTASPAGAAAPESRPAVASAENWQVTNSAFADLWYHGLAVVGFHGFGPNPLYDVRYGRQAARSRPDGPLAGAAPELLRELERDPAFELLHFIPVYLAGAGPREALAGLRSVSRSSELSSSASDPAMRSGLEVVGALLPEEAQRRTLGRFVDLLEREWAEGLEEEMARRQAADEPKLRALESRWTEVFVPALNGYLGAYGLTGGWIVPTPALGLEGRFFQGDPRSAGDNVVIIGLPSDDEGLDVALAPVVRELCFPAVRAAFQEVQSRYSDRVAASRASDAAATRCGELLLERELPEALPAYRTRFRLQGAPDAAWSSLPDPDERRAWDQALMRTLSLHGGS